MPNRSPRDQLISIQKRIFKKNAQKIKERTEVNSEVFSRYEREYRRYTIRYLHPVTKEELIGNILTHDIVYVGDYHTLKQAQRTIIRFIRDIYPLYSNLALALETVNGKYQKTIERYMAGQMDDLHFVRAIRYVDHWMFDTWANYKPIFDLAKQYNLPVWGLDHVPRGREKLYKRDDYAARRIAQIRKTHPKHKILVLFGELHISPNHLPRLTAEYLKAMGERKVKQLIVYQNCERIYWRLVEEKKEHKVDIVKISDNSFCMLNTPPIICQQSYLNWLEHEEGTIEFNAPMKNFKALARRIAEFLDIDIEGHIHDVEVFTCDDFSFLECIEKDRVFTKRELREIKKHILSCESYYIPKKKYVYLSDLSLNHAGEEAAHFIRHVCSGEEYEKTLADSFYLCILNEAVGFFGSKIVNHKRKAPTLQQMSEILNLQSKRRKTDAEKVQIDIAKLVVVHKKLEGNAQAANALRRIEIDDRMVFTAVTHILGYMIGNELYESMVAGRIAKRVIRDLFFNPFSALGEPQDVYFRLVERLGKV